MIIEKKPGIYFILVEEQKGSNNGRGRKQEKRRPHRKIYVGASSGNCSGRCATHVSQLKNGEHASTELQRDFDLGHDFEFVQVVSYKEGEKTKEQIFELERHLILQLKTYLPEYGYNTNSAPLSYTLRAN